MVRRTACVCALLLATLGGLAGCRKVWLEFERRQTWPRLRDAQARAYPYAWGTPIAPETVEANHREFDCTWDTLTREGGDPRADMLCAARAVEAMGACMAEHRENCLALGRTVCARSPEFGAASRACRPRSVLYPPL